MNLYYFFTKNRAGGVDYGAEYFVMSKSLDQAKKAVVNSEDYKKSFFRDINGMGVKILGANEVIKSEIS